MHRPSSAGRRRIISAAAVAGIVLVQPASTLLADPAVWNGDDNTPAAGNAGDNITWTNANNWSRNGVADTAAVDGDDLSFGTGTAGGIIDLEANRIANLLVFTKNYTLGLTNATTLTLTNTTGNITAGSGANGTINAILAGSSGLSLSGGGTLTLNRTGNTFTGNVTVSGAGTTLAVVGQGTADQTALGAGAKSVTLTNGGTFSLFGSTDFNPDATTKSLVIGTGGGTIDVASGRTVVLNDPGQFSGTGALTKTGAGLLHFNSQGYTYTGAAININAGTIRAQNAGSLGGTNVPITVAPGATFDVQATLSGTKPITVGGTGVGNNGALIAGGGTGVANGAVTLTADTNLGGNGTLTLSGVITDGPSAFNVTKVGTGLLVLSGANTYDGVTTVSSGVLRGASGTGLPAASNLTLNGGAFETTAATFSRALGTAAGEVQITGGTSGFSSQVANAVVNLGGAGGQVQWGSATFNPSTLLLQASTANNALTFQNPIDLNGVNRTITVNANTATLSGAVTTSTGTAGLTKSGGGTLFLGSASNSYNGDTTVSGGALRGRIGTNIPSTGNVNLTGGALETDVNVTDFGSGAGQVRITGGASGFSAFGAPINVNVGGSGDQVVWGSANFNPSTLVLNAVTANNTVTLQNPVDLNNSATAVTRTISVGANTAIINTVLSQSGSGAAGLTKSGSGTLVLGAANTYTGTTTLAGGTLSISALNNLGADGPVTFNGGTLRVVGTDVTSLTGRTVTFTNNAAAGFNIATAENTFTLAGPVSIGTGDFTKSGPGTLVMTGANSVRTLFANGGTIELGTGTLLLNNSGGSTIRGNANTTINGGTITISMSGTTGVNFGDNSVSPGVTLTINSKLTAFAGAQTGFEYCCDNPGGTIALTNPLNDFPGVIQINQPGTVAVSSIGNTGQASAAGAGSQIVLNSGTAPGGRLLYTGPGEITNRTVVLANTQGILDASGTTTAASPLRFTANVSVTNIAAKTFTLQGTGFGELGGVVPNNTAATSIVKTGAGTWALSAANTYTGTTTVNAGTLLANNTTGSATGTGAVTVTATGTLGGLGTIAGPVTVDAGIAGPGGPAISPGTSPGILSTGNLTLGSGSDAIFELFGTTPGSGHDQLNVTGTVNLGGADLIISAVSGLELGQQYTIINNDGGLADLITGTFSSGATVTGPNGSEFLIDYAGGDGNDVVLTTMAVPEPAAAGLLAAAGFGLLARRRRRA